MTSPESRASTEPDVADLDPAHLDTAPGRRRGPRRALLATAGVAVATLLAGCAEDAPQDIFQPAGEGAETINDLQTPVFIIAGVVGVLVAVAVVFVIFRFRSRGEDDTRVPKQLHGKTWAEITWTAAPAVLLLFVAVFTVATVIEMADTPDEAIEIDVIGQQWWWEFTYPETGIVTSGELVIPVDTDVVVNITSRDVIHSFWFPSLNGKRDAVPNRVHQLTLHGTEVGEFYGQCTEFCGLSHANMRMRALVLSQEYYAAWEANQQEAAAVPDEGTTAYAGYEAFGQRCASCHSITGQDIQPADVPLVAGVAPNLTHLMSRTTFAGAMFDLKVPECATAPEGPTGTAVECLNREQLSAWLRDPAGMKPMAPDEQRGMPNLGLTETDISNIVDYLSTLK
jgi:cytochrome c oxidase subunit 2